MIYAQRLDSEFRILTPEFLPIQSFSPNVELLTIAINDARRNHGADTGARTDYHPEWCPAIR